MADSPTIETLDRSKTPDMATLVLSENFGPTKESRPATPSVALGLVSVVGDKKDYRLQQIDPDFTDSSGECYRLFEKQLASLSGKNSETELCIEEFLTKSEKAWFNRFRDARLGRTPITSGVPTPAHSRKTSVDAQSWKVMDDEFLLGADYKPPTGLKK